MAGKACVTKVLLKLNKNVLNGNDIVFVQKTKCLGD